jgi:hypothetical protein
MKHQEPTRHLGRDMRSVNRYLNLAVVRKPEDMVSCSENAKQGEAAVACCGKNVRWVFRDLVSSCGMCLLTRRKWSLNCTGGVSGICIVRGDTGAECLASAL